MDYPHRFHSEILSFATLDVCEGRSSRRSADNISGKAHQISHRRGISTVRSVSDQKEILSRGRYVNFYRQAWSVNCDVNHQCGTKVFEEFTLDGIIGERLAVISVPRFPARGPLSVRPYGSRSALTAILFVVARCVFDCSRRTTYIQIGTACVHNPAGIFQHLK